MCIACFLAPPSPSLPCQAEYLVKMETTERERQHADSSRAERFLDYTTENIFRAQSELAEKVTSPFMKTGRGLWDKMTAPDKKEEKGGDEGGEEGGGGGVEEEEGGGEDFKDFISEDGAFLEGEEGQVLSPSSSFSSPGGGSQFLSPLPGNSPAPPPVGTLPLPRASPSKRTVLSSTSTSSSSHSSTFGSDVSNPFRVDSINEHNHEQWKARGKKKAVEETDHEDHNITPNNSPHTNTRRSRVKVSTKTRGGRRGGRGGKSVTVACEDSSGSPAGGGVRGNIKQVVGDVATGLGASISVFSNQVSGEARRGPDRQGSLLCAQHKLPCILYRSTEFKAYLLAYLLAFILACLLPIRVFVYSPPLFNSCLLMLMHLLSMHLAGHQDCASGGQRRHQVCPGGHPHPGAADPGRLLHHLVHRLRDLQDAQRQEHQLPDVALPRGRRRAWLRLD
jgi:hypothetical protein